MISIQPYDIGGPSVVALKMEHLSVVGQQSPCLKIGTWRKAAAYRLGVHQSLIGYQDELAERMTTYSTHNVNVTLFAV